MNDLNPSTRFRLGEDALWSQLNAMASPRMQDLLRIAMHVYVADRLTKRNGRNDIHGPSRLMPPVVVEVSDPRFWESISPRLQRILRFLSDDSWKLGFQQRRQHYEVQKCFYLPQRVCLYSGGLDSAAGLAKCLRNSNNEILAVTARHQAGQKKLVGQQIESFRKRFGNRVSSIMVRTTLRNAPPMNRQELTQRSRSFLFASLAGVVASTIGTEAIEVYENGVGVINLPLMPGMLTGGRTTKSAHPEFFRQMSRIVSLAADRSIRFELPFRAATKAELVKSTADEPSLVEVLLTSVSCVHFPLRIKGPAKHCGVCPGCIGRRQSLISAGIIEPTEKYRYDIFGDGSSVDGIPLADLAFLKATIAQIDALRLVRSHNHVVSLPVKTHLSRVLHSNDDMDAMLRLLERYRDEWHCLIEESLTKRRAWARWYGPVSSSSPARCVA